jgi:hypothetical protein
MECRLSPTIDSESRPMFNSNQAFLMVQNLKSAPPPKVFTLGVKAEIEKTYFQSAPTY